MEKESSKCVEIIGKNDKHQISVVLAGTVNGKFLPAQLVYKGTNKHCLPAFKFPDDWNNTCSHNHWCNEETMFDYLNKINFPYCAEKRTELKLPSDYPALLIFDSFNGQCTEGILKLIDDKDVIIPANCTVRLQPMDLSVNKALKDHLKCQL